MTHLVWCYGNEVLPVREGQERGQQRGLMELRAVALWRRVATRIPAHLLLSIGHAPSDSAQALPHLAPAALSALGTLCSAPSQSFFVFVLNLRASSADTLHVAGIPRAANNP